MTVLHIAYQYGLNNTGGAAIASTRLHNALLNAGIESHYVCLRQCEDGENVHVIPSPGSLLDRVFKIPKMRAVWNRFHLPYWGFEKLVKEINPDVVHVQWLNNGGPSFSQIVGLKRKTVVNLHDLWPISAVMPSPEPDDKRWINGYNKDNSTHQEIKEFIRKNHFISQLNPIFIGPSEWVCKCVRQSLIGQGYKVYAIPNLIDERYGFDASLYKKIDKFVILFGCNNGRRSLNKGYGDLRRALRCLPQSVLSCIEIRVFGEDKIGEELDDGIRIKLLGRISDIRVMKRIYNQADLYAFPSRSETQGLTKIEAMMCGLPVVAFERTACAEGIAHKITGWIARDGDYAAFAEGLMHYYELWKKDELRVICNNIARLSRIGVQKTVNQILKIYRSDVL